MNDQPSPLGRNNDDRSSSPKRKKARQKYAPKACVSCRRSKLKCSGDNPCQRCRDNGKRCFYSEDQTAAEALQNLSRPSLSQQPPTSTSPSNGIGLAQRSIMPRNQVAERKSSDASALGLSMEARMARVEAMMEAFLQDRATTATPNASMERAESASDLAMSMSSMSLPILDAINPALTLLGQPPQTAYVHPSSTSAIDPLLGADITTLRLGSRTLVFPTPTAYQRYVDSFFRELQCFHPCVDEQVFRLRSENVLAKTEVHQDDVCFLALNYIIFAWHDASTETTGPSHVNKPAGWHWLQLADDVVGSRQLYGQGDVSLAQFLVFKALYCALIDQPSLAYNTTGLASRYVLQQGLNRQSSYTTSGVLETYERLRVFWTVLIVDRRISLSCGRPYTIRDIDIDVERPSDMYHQGVLSDVYISDARAKLDESDSANAYLDCMIHWSRFAGSLWDNLLAAHVLTDTFTDKVATFDAAIADFFANTFPNLAKKINPLCRHQYIRMSFDNLRFMTRRAKMMSLQFDGATAGICSNLAVDTLAHVRAYESNTNHPSVLRHYMIPSLASSLLMLCSLLVSDLSLLGLDLDYRVPIYHQTFDSALGLLHALAQNTLLARRVLVDLEGVVPIVEAALARWSSEFSLLQSPPNWDLVKDVIPPDVAELFPYQEQVPVIHNRLWAENAGFLEADHRSSVYVGGLDLGGSRCSVFWI
ncbi:uncharacterized protein EKO05_0010738 [Ascochyta rabiei]|uniref:uncharacterized protein n=1 Tax=Didymella rabiei TaxID=5454 RepID=UPI0021FEF32F|nr:uncharacterized protein EKO05_0010738 [Ascochyta rabiei]UPX20508.1 hypothetical protein EKO05_0010738 [Ascochyta rabiei]